MTALRAVLTVLAVLLATYVPLYGFAARAGGYRLVTRLRCRGVVYGRAECTGGPFDGVDLPAPRAALLGFWIAPWPDVLYDGVTHTYRVAARVDHLADFDRRAVWAGYYMLGFMGDRYEWHGTGLERFSASLSVDGAA